MVQDYLSRAPEGDYAMLAGKPLTGYKCMSCDHPLEKLNAKRADYVPGGSLPKSNWALMSAERIYAGGMQVGSGVLQRVFRLSSMMVRSALRPPRLRPGDGCVSADLMCHFVSASSAENNQVRSVNACCCSKHAAVHSCVIQAAFGRMLEDECPFSEG